MFEPRTFYQVSCDAVGCIRTIPDPEDDQPMLIESPDLSLLSGYPASSGGDDPWVVWTERNRIMCPRHGHLLKDEIEIAQTHDPLF